MSLKTQTVRFSIEEENGLCDFGTITCKLTEDPKEEYLKLRIVQSVKGFKRPMPLNIEIEEIFINI